MDIDIDVGRIHLEGDEVWHLVALGDEMAEGFHHGIVETRMAHEATVDEEVLRCTFLPCRLGFAHEAAYPDERRLHLHRQQLLAKLLAEDAHDTLQASAGRQLHQLTAIAGEGEGNRRVDQGNALELLYDVVQLRLVRLEELTSCRYVEEEVAHLEVGSCWTSTYFLRDDPRTLEAQLHTQFLLGSASDQLDLRDGSDGGQCLTSEAHRLECKEVLGLRYLGGCMTLESHTGIRLSHALAVIYNLYGRTTCILHQHVNR